MPSDNSTAGNNNNDNNNSLDLFYSLLLQTQRDDIHQANLWMPQWKHLLH